MTGITNFFGNGTIKFGKVVIEETPLFDLEDSFESTQGWPGIYEFSSGILSSPEISESFESAEGWDTI